MIYDIESRADVSGAMLLVRFPEEDLDIKALYTIQADQPPFLVPFRHRCVDKQVECTYMLGDLSKLQYRYGTKTPENYVKFWEKIIQPLLDCGDWFLKPFSFVLDPLQLYTDREEKSICYLYVPSKRNCSSLDELRKMVSELSQKNPVTDTTLENKALRAIMQDFQPKSFLQMLRESQPKVRVVETGPIFGPQSPIVQETNGKGTAKEQEEARPVSSIPQPVREKIVDDDIFIDLNGSGEQKKSDKKKGLFGHRSDKKVEKPAKKGGLFGGKKEKKTKEIVLGAAAEEPLQGSSSVVRSAPVQHFQIAESEVTQLDESFTSVCLRLVGDPSLPREIPISLTPGAAFTIGRFDVSVGRKQSDFEFDKKTKAVSRHHAVIELRSEGFYTIMDLSSAAGTFVNGIRLTPNVPQRLERGNRIAFGTGGADYVWEE